MIPATELRGKAREHGVPLTTVERDYAQNWFLRALFSRDPDIVLKGGTGIRKVHIPDYRFSDDLDFSFLEDVDEKELFWSISNAVEMAGEESGISFRDSFVLKRNENGFVGRIYFRITRTSGADIGIKLDFTGRDNEVLLFPLETKPIVHPFSDGCEAAVCGFRRNRYGGHHRQARVCRRPSPPYRPGREIHP